MKKFWFSLVAVFVLLVVSVAVADESGTQYGIQLNDVYERPISIQKYESKIYEYEKASRFVEIIESQSDYLASPDGICMFFRMHDAACDRILTTYGNNSAQLTGGLYMSDGITGRDAILIYFNSTNDYKVSSGGGKLYRVDSDEYRAQIDKIMKIGRVNPFTPQTRNQGLHLEDY